MHGKFPPATSQWKKKNKTNQKASDVLGRSKLTGAKGVIIAHCTTLVSVTIHGGSYRSIRTDRFILLICISMKQLEAIQEVLFYSVFFGRVLNIVVCAINIML